MEELRPTPRNLEPFSLTREPTSSDMTGLPISHHASPFACFGFILSLGGLIANSHGWQRKHVTTLLSPKRRIRKSRCNAGRYRLHGSR